MGSGDGTIQGLAKILDNGPDTDRMNVVLVAEGFTAGQQSDFNDHCDDFVATLQAETWYPILGDAINVYRLNVASDDAGVDEPATCADGATGSGTLVDTYFDAGFCNSGIWRCLQGDNTLVRNTLDAQLPTWAVGIVLVNTTDHGGCASGNVSFTNVGTGWEDTALHEMGHNFGLADEYPTWEGCGSDETGQDNAPAMEPYAPNVTTETDRTVLKWRHLLSPGVPVPTMENPDCTACDERANVIGDDDAIGLFEGAQYYHCGRYRPAYRCRMKSSGDNFCRVCAEAIAAELNTYIPATPVLEVAPTYLNFGDVAFGLTLYLPVEIRNVRSGRPGPMEITLGTPTGDFAFAPDTETAFTLPAPIFESETRRLVFVAFTAPEAGGMTFNGSFTVTRSDDPAATPITVNLEARAVPPPPVDSVLVMDRSGSMSEPSGVVGMTKRDVALEAADLYVSLLKDNDQIGLVRYNNVSGAGDVLLAMTPAGDPMGGAGRAAARAALTPANLNPDNGTSIGAGIINGSGVLDGGSADARALVVLTDGRQNTSPDIPAGQAVVTTKTPRQRVFAVGLGLNQLEDRLEQIASVTGGTAQITGDLVDEREFLLQKLYVQILSDAADEAFVRDPKQVARAGERQATNVYLGEVDVAVDFIVVYRRSGVFPKYMRIWLEAPDGTLYTPADVAALPNAEYVEQPGHAYFRWQFPIAPDKPLAHAGVWKVWVENFYRGRVLDDVSSAYTGYAQLVYSVMAKARSDFRLGGRVLQESYLPGAPLEIVLEPTLYGVPVTVDPPVRVQITRPDGVVRHLLLGLDDYGAYSGLFTDTGLVGRYLVSADVAATTPLGHRVTRHRQMTGLIFYRRPDDGGWDPGDGAERPCREAQAALRTLARFVRWCCARGQDEIDREVLAQIDAAKLTAEITRRLEKDCT